MIGNRHLQVLFIVLSALLFLVNLDSTPPVWWDEGWTLTVARTFSERGQYSMLLNGEPAPAGLQAAFPVTGLVALVFRVLGVGVWQGRLVGVLYTIALLVVFFKLVEQLYDRRLAVAAVLTSFLMIMHPQNHPIVMGREVLAEPAMLFDVLVGFLFLKSSLEWRVWAIIPAIIFWGLALVTKAQALPFLGVAVIVPAVFALGSRRQKTAGLFVGAFLAAYILAQWANRAIFEFISGQAPAPQPVVGLTEAVAFVPILANRLLAFRIVLAFALPTLLGFAYVTFGYLRRVRSLEFSNVDIVRMALFVFAGSWFAWYLLLANAGIPRYLYPPIFIGSIYVALLLRDWTNDFNARETIQRAAGILRRWNLAALRALGAIVLVAIAVPFTLLMLTYFYFVNPDTSARQVAVFINSSTPSNSLIETYDAELFFFLNRRYHYPPDQAHVDLIRRTLDPSVKINYDPMAANPDYLIIGEFSDGWHVYDRELASDSFRLIRTEGRYRVFEHIR